MLVETAVLQLLVTDQHSNHLWSGLGRATGHRVGRCIYLSVCPVNRVDDLWWHAGSPWHYLGQGYRSQEEKFLFWLWTHAPRQHVHSELSEDSKNMHTTPSLVGCLLSSLCESAGATSADYCRFFASQLVEAGCYDPASCLQCIGTQRMRKLSVKLSWSSELYWLCEAY